MEWIWVFNNVPAGARYLQFGGRSGCRKYIWHVRFCDSNNPCNLDPCPTIRYNGLNTDAIITPVGNAATVYLGTNSVAGRVCILLQSCVDPLDPTCPPDCSSGLDHVSIDFLRVSTDLTQNCYGLQ